MTLDQLMIYFEAQVLLKLIWKCTMYVRVQYLQVYSTKRSRKSTLFWYMWVLRDKNLESSWFAYSVQLSDLILLIFFFSNWFWQDNELTKIWNTPDILEKSTLFQYMWLLRDTYLESSWLSYSVQLSDLILLIFFFQIDFWQNIELTNNWNT